MVLYECIEHIFFATQGLFLLAGPAGAADQRNSEKIVKALRAVVPQTMAERGRHSEQLWDALRALYGTPRS